MKYQEYERELNMSGIRYPVDIKHTGKFEHQNDISVNVYGCEDEKIFLVMYYQHGRCKTWHEFFIYYFWENISLRIGESLEQTGIETI